MLILTRFPGEMIRIGDDIIVKVFSVDGNKVRIGIAAPRNVIVDREEVAERRRRNEQAALAIRPATHQSRDPEPARPPAR